MFHADIIYLFAMQHGSFPVRIAYFFKKKIITDFYISFYDTEVNDRKNYKSDSHEARIAKKHDKNAIICSRLVFFLNQSEAEYYTKVLDIDITKINYRILPLCIDKKPPANMDFFQKKRKCLNLCWCGSYSPLQGLDVILKTVSLLKRKIDLHLYIWGSSDKSGEEYANLIDTLNIQDIVTIHNEWGNRKKWEDFIITVCDISLGIFGQSMKAKTVIANKVIDGVAFRTPVITARSQGLQEYFSGKDDIFITENNPDALAGMIEYVANKNIQTDSNLDRAYTIYQNHFSPEVFSKKLSIYLEEIMQPTSNQDSKGK
jgi:glycosyltransferase involved in cell wall biosynthesis